MSALGPATAEEREALVRLRRDFHRHPELGFQERRTASIVAGRVRELGYEVRERIAETGVLATRGAGRTLLVRSDMDALPILEQNDVEYKSREDGVMHACGHDGHMAIALTAASRFALARLPGRIRFAFQPAEEIGQGADRMIEEGALEGVDAAVGLHLWNWIPRGKVAVTVGPVMAASDEFVIDVIGRGGHAGKPHLTDDPVVKAAGVVLELQSIASRFVDPLQPVVVSVTKMEGGTAFNVIPDRVRLAGTIRTFDESVREGVHRRIREIVGEKGRVDIKRTTMALVNDARVAGLVREAAAAVVGEANVIHDARTTTSEDFASFAAKVPSCFFHVGSAGEDAAPHHHPRFDIDESAMALGLEILCGAAQRFLERGIR
ncbi:MAG: M20 metallopeptidase family protein [Candidatus Eiseniibacteriota bacterium]